jgi:hypothetical protein
VEVVKPVAKIPGSVAGFVATPYVVSNQYVDPYANMPDESNMPKPANYRPNGRVSAIKIVEGYLPIVGEWKAPAPARNSYAAAFKATALPKVNDSLMPVIVVNDDIKVQTPPRQASAAPAKAAPARAQAPASNFDNVEVVKPVAKIPGSVAGFVATPYIVSNQYVDPYANMPDESNMPKPANYRPNGRVAAIKIVEGYLPIVGQWKAPAPARQTYAVVFKETPAPKINDSLMPVIVPNEDVKVQAKAAHMPPAQTRGLSGVIPGYVETPYVVSNQYVDPYANMPDESNMPKPASYRENPRVAAIRVQPQFTPIVGMWRAPAPQRGTYASAYRETPLPAVNDSLMPIIVTNDMTRARTGTASPPPVAAVKPAPPKVSMPGYVETPYIVTNEYVDPYKDMPDESKRPKPVSFRNNPRVSAIKIVQKEIPVVGSYKAPKPAKGTYASAFKMTPVPAQNDSLMPVYFDLRTGKPKAMPMAGFVETPYNISHEYVDPYADMPDESDRPKPASFKANPKVSAIEIKEQPIVISGTWQAPAPKPSTYGANYKETKEHPFLMTNWDEIFNEISKNYNDTPEVEEQPEEPEVQPDQSSSFEMGDLSLEALIGMESDEVSASILISEEEARNLIDHPDLLKQPRDQSVPSEEKQDDPFKNFKFSEGEDSPEKLDAKAAKVVQESEKTAKAVKAVKKEPAKAKAGKAAKEEPKSSRKTTAKAKAEKPEQNFRQIDLRRENIKIIKEEEEAMDKRYDPYNPFTSDTQEDATDSMQEVLHEADSYAYDEDSFNQFLEKTVNLKTPATPIKQAEPQEIVTLDLEPETIPEFKSVSDDTLSSIASVKSFVNPENPPVYQTPVNDTKKNSTPPTMLRRSNRTAANNLNGVSQSPAAKPLPPVTPIASTRQIDSTPLNFNDDPNQEFLVTADEMDLIAAKAKQIREEAEREAERERVIGSPRENPNRPQVRTMPPTDPILASIASTTVMEPLKPVEKPKKPTITQAEPVSDLVKQFIKEPQPKNVRITAKDVLAEERKAETVTKVKSVENFLHSDTASNNQVVVTPILDTPKPKVTPVHGTAANGSASSTLEAILKETPEPAVSAPKTVTKPAAQPLRPYNGLEDTKEIPVIKTPAPLKQTPVASKPVQSVSAKPILQEPVKPVVKAPVEPAPVINTAPVQSAPVQSAPAPKPQAKPASQPRPAPKPAAKAKEEPKPAKAPVLKEVSSGSGTYEFLDQESISFLRSEVAKVLKGFALGAKLRVAHTVEYTDNTLLMKLVKELKAKGYTLQQSGSTVFEVILPNVNLTIPENILFMSNRVLKDYAVYRGFHISQ